MPFRKQASNVFKYLNNPRLSNRRETNIMPKYFTET